MTEFLQTVHMYLGYLVAVIVLVAGLLGSRRAKDAREFLAGPYAGPMVLLDIQVTLGLVLYAVGGYWDARPELAYIHPLFAVAALAVGHAALGRARRHQMAVDAHRAAGRGLLFALLLVVIAIGIASAPPFL